MSKTKETNLSEENVSLDENKTNEELRLLKSKVVDDVAPLPAPDARKERITDPPATVSDDECLTS